jgi:hypothetical protein
MPKLRPGIVKWPLESSQHVDELFVVKDVIASKTRLLCEVSRLMRFPLPSADWDSFKDNIFSLDGFDAGCYVLRIDVELAKTLGRDLSIFADIVSDAHVNLLRFNLNLLCCLSENDLHALSAE